MASKIFVNLPVKDLNKSIEFFTKLGYRFNPQFTDDTATCMIISDNIFVMLLTEKKFREFTKKEISDAKKTTEVLIALDAESREKVNELVENAISAGGTIYSEPIDHGWMYFRSFADLDGHQWEIGFMDESKMPDEMKNKKEEKTEIVIEASIKAPINKIWEFWTEPEHIINWNNASDDWHTPRAENDLRVGGKFTSHMAAKDGSAEFDFEGVYDEVIINELIRYTMTDGRKVTTEFIKGTGKHKVITTFEAENSNSVEMQKSGWQAILNNFKKYTEEKS